MSKPSTEQQMRYTINGAEMPKRIWLMCYLHAGDVCWTTDPNPEDADEIETVEYVRADTPTPDVVEALREAMRRYPESRAGLAWFAAASGLSAGEITQEVLDWASNHKDSRNG